MRNRLVLEEISYMLKHIRRLPEKNGADTSCSVHSRSSKSVALWRNADYEPLELPLYADTLSAGGCVGRGKYRSSKTKRLFTEYKRDLTEILSQCFDPQYVAVVPAGGRNTCLLREHFDYIFFTGSQTVGKEVMRNAAEYLTPVTLSWEGKVPAVDQTADIRLRPDAVFLEISELRPDLCGSRLYILPPFSQRLAGKEIQRQIQLQYGEEPLHNPDYGKIINKKHFDRILGLIEEKKIVHGGNSDRDTLRIEPTVLDNVTFADPVMQKKFSARSCRSLYLTIWTSNHQNQCHAASTGTLLLYF